MRLNRLLVTGCAGFIGSNFVRYSLATHPDCQVLGLDKLTYAGNLDNLKHCEGNPNFSFIHGDICDAGLIGKTMGEVDAVVNFAADSMVDRSIENPGPFLATNIVGVDTLLRAARQAGIKRFLQISTQEVYGHLPLSATSEVAHFAPRNIYAACKASAEMLVSSYFHAFNLPAVITRGSNAMGPFQHPEKVTPLFITNAIEGKPLPLYGDGSAMRDFIHVDDLNAANDLVLREGTPGEAYNVTAGQESTGLDLAHGILKLLRKDDTLIRFVEDRAGHDYRYYLNTEKITALGWRRTHAFQDTLGSTVQWYVDNEPWWRKIKDSSEFAVYYERAVAARIRKAENAT